MHSVERPSEKVTRYTRVGPWGNIPLTSERRLKLVLQDGVEIRDLYGIAARHGVQIRRLNFKRDSLEDIFLKAMEDGNGGL